jgi:hypothetical protein
MIKKGPDFEFVIRTLFRTFYNEIPKYSGLNKPSWYGLGAISRRRDAAISRMQ